MCKRGFPPTPTRKNGKLKKLINHINEDAELLQLWKCANINAVDRSGINDHGEVHIRIVSNAALKILRLLVKGGVEPSVVKDHGMKIEDAEVIIVLAACLHDIGISAHRDDHERYSLFLAVLHGFAWVNLYLVVNSPFIVASADRESSEGGCRCETRNFMKHCLDLMSLGE